MKNGYFIDSFRLGLRSVSDAVVASWADDVTLLDTDYGSIRVKDTGGLKPTIVFVPDGPCVIEHFDRLINELSQSFRVICFDMPGLGFSYPSANFDFGLNASVEVVVSVLDKLNIEAATLSFSCVNSYVAIAAARLHPERVSRLVLAQSPAVHLMSTQWLPRNIPKPVRIPYVGQIFNAAMSKKFSSRWFDIALPRGSVHKEDFNNTASSALRSGGCFCLASIVQGMGNLETSVLSGVEVPTTMVWGNQDWSHKNTNFESFRDHAPDCEIIEFDGCGHFPYLEKPVAFASLLREMS